MREREREREREINLLVHLFKDSLVPSYCPDLRSNLQSWRIRTILQPTEYPARALPTFELRFKLDSLSTTETPGQQEVSAVPFSPW